MDFLILKSKEKKEINKKNMFKFPYFMRNQRF